MLMFDLTKCIDESVLQDGAGGILRMPDFHLRAD